MSCDGSLEVAGSTGVAARREKLSSRGRLIRARPEDSDFPTLECNAGLLPVRAGLVLGLLVRFLGLLIGCGNGPWRRRLRAVTEFAPDGPREGGGHPVLGDLDQRLCDTVVVALLANAPDPTAAGNPPGVTISRRSWNRYICTLAVDR